MQLKSFASDYRFGATRFTTFAIGLVGVGHFLLSLVTWGMFYVAAYRQEWHEVLTLRYGARHLTIPVILLACFAWMSIAAWRRYRFLLPQLLVALALSAAAFTVEARDVPQLQTVWFEEDSACSCRQNFYCTWWWWQPRIR